MRVFLWVRTETANIATDLAEVIGTTITLNLLFRHAPDMGRCFTALDVFLILWLHGKGLRRREAVVITLNINLIIELATGAG